MTISMPDQTTASPTDSASSDKIDRLLRSPFARGLVLLLVLMLVIAAGIMRGIGGALLVLASAMLLLIISLLWNSLQGLTGESAISLEEALGLGAPSAEEEQKRAVLRALKDLEYEHSVGKISEEDYAQLTAQYRAEAKALLRSLDQTLAPNREHAEKLLEKRLAEENLDEKGRTHRADKRKNKKKKPKEEPAPDAVEDESADEPEEEPESTEAEATSAPGHEPAAESGEPEAKPARTSTPAPRAPTRRCAKCETRNDLDARFCKGCGATMAAEGKLLCTACPAVYDDTLDACPDCGVPREDT